MQSQIIDELQTVSALIQTVADAVANRFGATDTEHLDICLSLAVEKLENVFSNRKKEMRVKCIYG